MHSDLTQAELIRLLNYDPETGVFTHKARRCGVTVGSVAGSVDRGHGYSRIKIDERLYLAHRLAWLYVYGEWPAQQIDHRDRDRGNNRINNLRCATASENMFNKPIYKNNSSGAKGVSWHKQHRKYIATIHCNGKSRHLGLFATVDEASAVYQEACKRLHGQFASAA